MKLFKLEEGKSNQIGAVALFWLDITGSRMAKNDMADFFQKEFNQYLKEKNL